jgi:glycosyltransferase involved in cell wall biosynthesis
MKVALLAPLHEAVPPRQYGGTERVVAWLADALVRKGHSTTLFASGDSQTAARVVPVVPQALRPNAAQDPIGPHLAMLAMLRDRLDQFDVVHSHIDYFACPFARPEDPPIVHTMHGRLDGSERRSIYHAFRRERLVSISDAQREPLPDMSWVATVHHGLPLDEFPVGDGSGGYVLFLGRVSSEKRPHVAIDLARKVGIPLVIAAKVDRVDRAYFESALAPRLRQPGVDFVGETGPAETLALLQEARALLFPIDWPEPFGLVMIEAMACGTPVLTLRRGSAAEVVEHGVTGFVCDDEAELGRALGRIDRIDRAACRRRVEEHFSAERMASDYEAIYRRLRWERMSRWKTSSAFTTATTSSPPPASRTTVLES